MCFSPTPLRNYNARVYNEMCAVHPFRHSLSGKWKIIHCAWTLFSISTRCGVRACVRATIEFSALFTPNIKCECEHFILRRQTGAPILFAFHLTLAHISCDFATHKAAAAATAHCFHPKITWTRHVSRSHISQNFPYCEWKKTESVYKWLRESWSHCCRRHRHRSFLRANNETTRMVHDAIQDE